MLPCCHITAPPACLQATDHSGRWRMGATINENANRGDNKEKTMNNREEMIKNSVMNGAEGRQGWIEVREGLQ